MFFKTYWILWQNARNLNYIKWYNNSLSRSLADSKLRTKEFLSEKWISIVDTLVVIDSHEELKNDFLDDLNLPFVIKPNNWYWWKWIIILEKKDIDWNYISNSWKIYSKKFLKWHFSDILDWFFSLSWVRDSIIIEKKVIVDHQIELLWKFWLPDIRVIVFNNVPIMAMLRVPTRESNWKANLHAWACWVWIDIWTWKLTYITKSSKIIKSIPDIWDVRWIKIPKWEEILTLAVKVQYISKIWYVWCDIVLDDKKGPILLEMNIRPWLEIQVANISPLKDRLDKVSWINVNSVEKWVRLWRDLFSWEIEEKIKNITWRKIIWVKEYITIIYGDKKYKYLSEINIWENSSYIDRDFLKNILKINIENKNEIKLKFDLYWEIRVVRFIIKDNLWFNISLWKIWLKWFLIDPFKYRKWEYPTSNEVDFLKSKNIAIRKTYEEILTNINKQIISLDKKLIILKPIRPINTVEEKEKFIKSEWKYIPKFKYEEFNLDLNWIEKSIDSINIPDIPLSSIYNSKKQEIKNKIYFLNAFKNKNYKDFTNYSKKIYWNIIKTNLSQAIDKIEHIWNIMQESELVHFEDVRNYVNKFNHIYWIKISLKKTYWSSRFFMKWNNLFFRENAIVWRKELRSIIAHEIEWHYLRKVNWSKLKYSIFSHWTAWYLSTEEWVAIYNQNRFLNESSKKYYSIYERYFFVNYALNNSYNALISKMIDYYNWDYEKIFNYILRLKSWFEDISKDWCFVKDVVYLNWFLDVTNYLSSWWKLKDLYIWKINISDLAYIKDSYFLNLDFKNIKVPFSI